MDIYQQASEYRKGGQLACQSTTSPKRTSSVFLVLQGAAIAQLQQHGDTGAGDIIVFFAKGCQYSRGMRRQNQIRIAAACKQHPLVGRIHSGPAGVNEPLQALSHTVCRSRWQ